MNGPYVFTERLNKAMKEAGISTKEMAEKIGVTELEMSRFRTGERIPRGPQIAKMADALGTNTNWILGVTDER